MRATTLSSLMLLLIYARGALSDGCAYRDSTCLKPAGT